ncbi:uncharacterized protein PADG_00536 [Paracoccidioides brasiliensis Pb18]|uniref:Uncharacterized protein n=2 Tax=Paracoccidioides brasiliensis TaxID=121759 RepID=C1G0Z6_PARBD|nr:uncharacterized protein PADG_00536 [Paracoccidioides brasiliensis Pb18]EEH44247.2 hypothetical protein PADG_00536 [Paracoccidioides brasiliensis Pb18]ODH32777.1 hypothetical protein ACO22_03357 [Paracoccidioides brasiliensis]
MIQLLRTVVPRVGLRLQAFSPQLSPPGAALNQPAGHIGRWLGKCAYSEGSSGKSDGAKERGPAYGHGDGEEHYHRKYKVTPDRAETDSFNDDFEHRIPSNKARPTLSDEYQHSGIDAQHPKRPSKEDRSPEELKRDEEYEVEVRKHNEEVERRYDRAVSQIDHKEEFRTLEEEVESFKNEGE